jgi:penicillin-insensitive murein endopeptidase
MASALKIAALLLNAGALACFGVAGALASAEPAVTFQSVRTPAAGAPLAIGDYSSGCVQGAAALPLDGPGYQVMHPARLRYFGHPELIDFIEKLGAGVQRKKLGVLLVGDLSQPRGGRASGGHASHQSGLDVDLWYWHSPAAATGPLSTAQREQTSARSVLDGKTSAVRAEWSHKVTELLRLTASDPRVERVFVHPIIKREQCEKVNASSKRGSEATLAEGGDPDGLLLAPTHPGRARALPAARSAWLQKIRPWYGHDDHFHVRLGCPKDSPDCERQEAVPAGDGCAELEWWFSEETKADREKARGRYQGKVVTPREPPALCREVLAK